MREGSRKPTVTAGAAAAGYRFSHTSPHDEELPRWGDLSAAVLSESKAKSNDKDKFFSYLKKD